MEKVNKIKNLIFLVWGLFFISSEFVFAQPLLIYGEVTETYSKQALPFVHIIVNGGEDHFLSNADGKFSFPLNEAPKQIEFRLLFHKNLIITPEIGTESLETNVTLNRNKFFIPADFSDAAALKIIKRTLANKKVNSPKSQENFSYNSYNKFPITTEDLEETKREMRKILRWFKFRIKDYEHDHHLFLMESVTFKNYLNSLNQKESIIAAEASGLDSPSLLTLASLWQPFSVYENYLSIATDDFISPLAGNALKRYNFSMVDTAYVGADTIWVIKYNPAVNRKLDKVSGLLYINSKNHAIQYLTAMPASENSLGMGIMQEYSLINDSIWFPSVTKSQYAYDITTSKNIRIRAQAQNHISNVTLKRDLKFTEFDEIAIDYLPQVADRSGSFWQKARVKPLSAKDEHTYAFYDSLGNIKNFQRLIKSGHNLYFGLIPIRQFTVDLNRVLNFNEYEGFRVGFGGFTNNYFSKTYSLGGYFGFGSKDEMFKYGANGTYLLRPENKIQVHAGFYKDLAEPGATDFAFDKTQYSAEPLRKYRLTRLDIVSGKEAAVSIQPYRNLYFQAGFNVRKHLLPYAYQFNDNNTDEYKFSEFRSTLRYSFGEQFIRSERDLYSLGTQYPEFWLQYTGGFKNFIFGDYNYSKLDAKIQQKIKILGFGLSGWQLSGGVSSGTLPYSVLYNAKGSYRKASIVTHNSFETMQYNEFLSDRYFSVFYSHDFGRLYERSSFFKPNLEMLHNMGFGWLKSPKNHQSIVFKTMERGYFESGFFTNNLLVVNLIGLKVGTGAGLFLRYGPYANPSFGDNIYFKFATNFTM